jgi:rhodanese-related sulfurtransferase
MNEFVKLVKTKETPFVIYCAHANRTKVVGNFLDSQMGYKEVYDLKGGINLGWIKKGLKTVRD